MSKQLISLDASSSIIGISIFNKHNHELVFQDYILHDKEKDLIERVIVFKTRLKELLLIYKEIDELVIEQSFSGFFNGGSSAHTIEVLTSVNFGYRLIAYLEGLKVSIISVSDSRKYCFPTIKIKLLAKAAGIKEKELCFQMGVKLIGEDKLPKKIMNRGKNKGKEVYEDYCYDMVDSYIVGIGYLRKVYSL